MSGANYIWHAHLTIILLILSNVSLYPLKTPGTTRRCAKQTGNLNQFSGCVAFYLTSWLRCLSACSAPYLFARLIIPSLVVICSDKYNAWLSCKSTGKLSYSFVMLWWRHFVTVSFWKTRSFKETLFVIYWHFCLAAVNCSEQSCQFLCRWLNGICTCHCTEIYSLKQETKTAITTIIGAIPLCRFHISHGLFPEAVANRNKIQPYD